MLAQGGEFAFVLLSLAAELKVLPEELNKLLIIVVVISMALTPGLASVGRYLADRAVEDESESGTAAHFEDVKASIPLFITCRHSYGHSLADSFVLSTIHPTVQYVSGRLG